MRSHTFHFQWVSILSVRLLQDLVAIYFLYFLLIARVVYPLRKLSTYSLEETLLLAKTIVALNWHLCAL